MKKNDEMRIVKHLLLLNDALAVAATISMIDIVVDVKWCCDGDHD